jgi:O-antigen/teichoic acid export membrane protein
MSLTTKAFSGFSFIFLTTLISRLAAMAGVIVLSRLLNPEDFGLIATLYIIFEISSFLISAGFGLVIIREKEISEADLATVFWFNLMMSFTLMFLIWISSPMIADFFNQPRLELVARIMSLNLVFSSFGLVQSSMFQRELNFKIVSLIPMFASISSTIVAVVLAYSGFGHLSLAYKFIVGSFLTSLLYYWIRPWSPKFFIKTANFKRLFAFGGNVMLLGLVNTISRNLHQIVISKYFSISALGYFNQGNNLKDSIIDTISETTYKVSFPLLAKLQNDHERIKSAYRRILGITSYAIFPTIVLLIITAKPLIIVLLGVKWLETVFYFQIFLISGGIKHIHKMNLNILKVFGKGKDYLMQGVFRNIMVIFFILVSLRFGPKGVAIGLICADFMQIFINIYFSNKHLKFSLFDQLTTMLPIIILNGFILLIGVLIVENVSFSDVATLLIVPPILLIIYLALSHLFSLKAYLELKEMIGHRFSSTLIK